MARDDWRIRIELDEHEAAGLLSRLGLDLGSEARELARELEERRLAVSRDGESVYIYAGSSLEAEQARDVAEAVLREEGIAPRSVRIEHWLTEEDRWNDEPASEPDVAEDVLRRGYAPWEVRVECESAGAARELAERLEDEGYGVVHHFRYVIAGTATREEAAALARRVHGEVEPGGELVWEVAPQNPFAIFGGLGV
ncbi:MAG: hypothetical protein M3292_08660 [Actinomycetota bacterium]|jgi:hypothetical protein|nr:hypothetical protein [Actinomycetota bacterium]